MNKNYYFKINLIRNKFYFKKRDTCKKLSMNSVKENPYIKINTLDGQIKVPEDALPALNEWSGRINMLTTYENFENIPTFNVSSSYLIRLISIARASVQYFSLLDELMEKKREQIVRMFNFHSQKEFTSFYDEEMEMTPKLSEFMEAISISEKSFVNYWTLPYSFLQKVGITIDPMDSSFTIPQYITVAVFSYLNHLEKTKPEEIKGLIVSPTLLENPNTNTYREFISQKYIRTWIPINIIIGEITINLVWLRHPDMVEYLPIESILFQLKNVGTKKSETAKFLVSLSKIIKRCQDPLERKWLE